MFISSDCKVCQTAVQYDEANWQNVSILTVTPDVFVQWNPKWRSYCGSRGRIKSQPKTLHQKLTISEN